MHSDDSKNTRDEQGRVLVNVNRPPNEKEIFLAPQLASVVLPHQVKQRCSCSRFDALDFFQFRAALDVTREAEQDESRSAA